MKCRMNRDGTKFKMILDDTEFNIIMTLLANVAASKDHPIGLRAHNMMYKMDELKCYEDVEAEMGYLRCINGLTIHDKDEVEDFVLAFREHNEE